MYNLFSVIFRKLAVITHTLKYWFQIFNSLNFVNDSKEGHCQPWAEIGENAFSDLLRKFEGLRNLSFLRNNFSSNFIYR